MTEKQIDQGMKHHTHVTLENEFREALKNLFRARGFAASADEVAETLAVRFASQVNDLVPILITY